MSLRHLRAGTALALILLAAQTAMPARAATSPASDAATANTVRIDNFSFSPKTLTVTAGTTVTWVNRDDEPHTVTSGDEPRTLGSAALDTDERFTYTFAKPGTYPYFCKIHPHMTGVIVVK